MAVTAVACTYQCAETTRMARGRGTAWPNARQAAVYRFFSRAFIGLPWPKNAAGMTVIRITTSVLPRSSPGAAPTATQPDLPGLAGRDPAQRRRQPAGPRPLGGHHVAGVEQPAARQRQATA